MLIYLQLVHFVDAVTTMLGTADILGGSSGNNKPVIIGVALIFALLITIIVASSESLLIMHLNNFVLPIVIIAFFYDFYTSVLGVASLILDKSPGFIPTGINYLFNSIRFMSYYDSFHHFIGH